MIKYKWDMGYLVFTEEYVPKKVKIRLDEIRTYVLLGFIADTHSHSAYCAFVVVWY